MKKKNVWRQTVDTERDIPRNIFYLPLFFPLSLLFFTFVFISQFNL